MALLTVLLLVAVMAVLAVIVLDDVRFSIRRGINAQAMTQAQWHAMGAESLARVQIRRLADRHVERTPLTPRWNGAPVAFPLDDGGVIRAVLRDGQACFNLNSVVEGAPGFWIPQPRGAAQFAALARALGVAEGEALRLADVLTDWIDTNAGPQPLGAEDPVYAGLPSPRRTAGGLMVETSELRALLGMDAALYDRLAPFVCALPEATLSPVNPNTLTEDQWPVLVMLTEGRISAQQARGIIRSRPVDGWVSVNAFWTQAALADLDVPAQVHDQISLKTRYFALRADVSWGGAEVTRTSLLRDVGGAVTVVTHRWGPGI